MGRSEGLKQAVRWRGQDSPARRRARNRWVIGCSMRTVTPMSGIHVSAIRMARKKWEAGEKDPRIGAKLGMTRLCHRLYGGPGNWSEHLGRSERRKRAGNRAKAWTKTVDRKRELTLAQTYGLEESLLAEPKWEAISLWDADSPTFL